MESVRRRPSHPTDGELTPCRARELVGTSITVLGSLLERLLCAVVKVSNRPEAAPAQNPATSEGNPSEYSGCSDHASLGYLPFRRRPGALRVTYFVDLSVYSYGGLPEPRVMNVGWLSKDHPFQKGETSEAFRAALEGLCITSSIHHFRGWHDCEFCVCASLKRSYFHEMGNGEIRVRGQGRTWYSAPRLVSHYVVTHGYRPPAEFIAAVMNRNEAGAA
jgi:hypothetical protein